MSMMSSGPRLTLLASLCAAAACGSVKDQAGHLPDGGTPADAPPTGPVRGTVHVTVLEPAGTGNPAVGATVVFVDTDGTVTKKTTDTAGKANADLLPGASVTSVVLVNTQYTLQTVLALKPADDITLGAKNVDAASAGTFAVTVPPFGNSTSYSVSTPCGSYPAIQQPTTGLYVASIVFTNDCKKSPFEMVVVARIGNPSAEASSIDIPSVAFVPNGSYTVTGAYTGLQSVTSSYTNINPNVAALQTSRVVPDQAGIVELTASAAPTGATMSTVVTGGLSSKAQILTAVTKGVLSSQIIRQPIPGTASTYGLDVGATLLPWINGATYDATTAKVVVPVDTTGTTMDKPDLFGLGIHYSRDDGTTTTSFDWSFFGPEIGDIALPPLPADLGPLLPTANDAVNITVAAAFDAASVAGYDAVRNNTRPAFTSYTSARPADTNIRVTRYVILRRL
ncbi:MAG TPA: hypothetical protein VGC42_25355 [Kofleriaceae bacterium]